VPPEPKPEPPKPEPPKPEPPPEPKKAETPPPELPKPLPVSKPKPPEPPRKPEEKPVDLAKLQPKQDHPPKPPTPKQQESDFDSLLASVEAQAKRVKEPERRDAKGVSAERGGTNQAGPNQQAQVDPSALVMAISRQVTPCWNIPVGAQGVEGLRAELHILLGPDGSVQSVEPMDAARMADDPTFRTFAESAVRAVRACSPLKLPPEQYQVWRNIIFNFDPSMLTG
jgi:outer membrane biosynthesis protein TonB